MYIHFSCTLVPSGSKEIFDRKTKTVFAMVVLLYREKKTSKPWNISCKSQDVDKVVPQAIFEMKNDEWSIEVNGRLAFVNDLRTENSVYHIHCSSNFQTDKGKPKKSVMLKKRGRHTTADKETMFLEIVKHIESHSEEHFDGRKFDW